ncbi:MAG: helix-turn-helix domain-containing protein [bacterium]|nr:helix-turn-helix domain-containing protein [bacterium]
MLTILEELGLSPNEAKIYKALLEHGEMGVSDISLRAKIHRRNTYDAINRLVEKGLAFEILSAKENTYNAVDPEKLLELVDEKRQSIESLLPSLIKQFKSRKVKEEAYILKGLEGQKNIWREVLRVAETSYFIGAKGEWFDERLKTSKDAFFKEANRKNISFKQLFDFETRERLPEILLKYPAKNSENRILPKEYSTSSAIHVFGDYVVTYTGLSVKEINEDITFFVIKSKELANSYRTWFEFLWNKSKPQSPK